MTSEPRFYWCGGCEHYHPDDFTGDCREDDQRFTSEQLDEEFPEGWIEVVLTEVFHDPKRH